MKNIIPILITTLFCSCFGNSSFKSAEQRLDEYRKDSARIADSLRIIEYGYNTESNKRSIESFLDTIGYYKYPVKILQAKFYTESYSNYKSVLLKFKNVSGKDIQAIRFEWYGINSFNEPADMGITEGYGSGFDDELLKTGASRTSTWSIMSNDGKKIIGARAYEVAFTDGTKWKRE